jgi:hypothetical protein
MLMWSSQHYQPEDDKVLAKATNPSFWDTFDRICHSLDCL